MDGVENADFLAQVEFCVVERVVERVKLFRLRVRRRH